MLIVATARDQVANFVAALVGVYSILIIAYIFSQLYLSFGGRVPYSRGVSAFLSFLRDVSEPYLSIFRRFIPPLGPIDLSPLIGLVLLGIIGGIVESAIRG
jgi:YggT family protein